MTIATSAGDVGATLDADAAPCTVNSFLSLADQGYFDDTPCHRLTTAGIFVLQCGDPTGIGARRPRLLLPRRARAVTRPTPAARSRWPTPGPTPTARSSSWCTTTRSSLPPTPSSGRSTMPGSRSCGDVAAKGTANGCPRRSAEGAGADRVRHRRLTRRHSGNDVPVSASERDHNALASSGSLAAGAAADQGRPAQHLPRPVRADVAVAGEVHRGGVDRGQRALPGRHARPAGCPGRRSR